MCARFPAALLGFPSLSRVMGRIACPCPPQVGSTAIHALYFGNFLSKSELESRMCVQFRVNSSNPLPQPPPPPNFFKNPQPLRQSEYIPVTVSLTRKCGVFNHPINLRNQNESRK